MVNRRNALSTYWNPMYLHNFHEEMARLAGVPKCRINLQNNEISLEFLDIQPGQSLQRAIPDRLGFWAITDMQATSRTDSSDTSRQEMLSLINLSVSSNIISDEGNTLTLTENQPIPMVFGTGEWTASGFISMHKSSDRRIFTVTNEDSIVRSVVLGFRLVTMLVQE